MSRISMTWAQYKRRTCLFNGKEVKLTRTMAEVLFILLVRGPRPVPILDIILFMYPNPDKEPEYAADIVRRYVFRLRRLLDYDIIMLHPSRIGYLIPEEMR